MAKLLKVSQEDNTEVVYEQEEPPIKSAYSDIDLFYQARIDIAREIALGGIRYDSTEKFFFNQVPLSLYTPMFDVQTDPLWLVTKKLGGLGDLEKSIGSVMFENCPEKELVDLFPDVSFLTHYYEFFQLEVDKYLSCELPKIFFYPVSEKTDSLLNEHFKDRSILPSYFGVTVDKTFLGAVNYLEPFTDSNQDPMEFEIEFVDDEGDDEE